MEGFSTIVLDMYSLCSRNMGTMESNEVEFLVILEALRFLSSFNGKLVVESNSLNAIYWVSSLSKIHWRFHFYFNETMSLASLLDVIFKHVHIRWMVLQIPCPSKRWETSVPMVVTMFFYGWCFEYSSCIPAVAVGWDSICYVYIIVRESSVYLIVRGR